MREREGGTYNRLIYTIRTTCSSKDRKHCLRFERGEAERAGMMPVDK